jgi:hypothetical protein
MRTFIFIPPLRKATGGAAVLVDIGCILHAAGLPVRIVLREQGTWLPDTADGLERQPWSGLDLEPGDLWLVPEGWVNALAPGLKAGARCVVYSQSWIFLFTGLPPGTDWRSLPVSFLAVSQPVAVFIREALGLRAPILRPGIDPSVFRPGPKSPATLRVAYMPRKNKALAELIRNVWQARNPDLAGRVEWVPVQGLDRAGVAAALGGAHVFLSTGFPEGCPLPPLEAMACGCLCAGFAGTGGWDYMRQASVAGVPGYQPWLPLREVPWGGNGLWAADGDVLGAALALEGAVNLWRAGGPGLEEVLANGAATAAAYGLDAQREAVLETWQGLAAGL